ncbi:MAG: hypothetical protein U1E53_14955 [Dongiaceae bacterium]
MRAADLIGQLADPLYPGRRNALFHAFAEIGADKKLGYANPGDLADAIRNSSGARWSAIAARRCAISSSPWKASSDALQPHRLDRAWPSPRRPAARTPAAAGRGAGMTGRDDGPG